MATNGDVSGVKRKRAETSQSSIDPTTKTPREDFEAVFPGLVKDLSEHAQNFNIPKEALEWFLKVSPTVNASSGASPNPANPPL